MIYTLPLTNHSYKPLSNGNQTLKDSDIENKTKSVILEHQLLRLESYCRYLSKYGDQNQSDQVDAEKQTLYAVRVSIESRYEKDLNWGQLPAPEGAGL